VSATVNETRTASGAALLKRIAREQPDGERREDSAGAQRRRRALANLLERGLPSSRDENWRYANLRPLERVRFAPAPSPDRLETLALPAPIASFVRYVFIDGRFDSSLSAPRTTGSGVQVEPLRSDAEPDATLPSAAPEGAFALLNAAFATDGVQVRVPRETTAAIEIVFVARSPAERGASYPRLHIEVGARGVLRLIERHVSAAQEASFVTPAVTVTLAEGGRLDHYRIQALAPRALWMDTLSATLARSAHYRLHAVGLGAQSSRSTLAVRLAGEEAQLSLDAVAVGDRQQVHDTYAVVEHAAARTRTEETFRGIAGARSRLAFNGKIIVHPGAYQADSSQSLRGLLAGPEAEIDVRPQLEIYTDDVRCKHGATAGKLDEAMLFYLLSRGLEPATAQQLLQWAFLEDVVARITVPELRRQIEQSLAGQMREPEVLKELI
jgi:Fe-S cluster assembly protein SufD